MTFETIIDMGELGDQEVTVEFDFERGCAGSFDEPGYSASVEITKIVWNGADIRPFAAKDLNDRLVQEAFEHIEDIGRQAQEDHAEAMYEMRRAA